MVVAFDVDYLKIAEERRKREIYTTAVALSWESFGLYFMYFL